MIVNWLWATLSTVFLWNVEQKLRTKAWIYALVGMRLFTGVYAIVRTVVFMRVAWAMKAADFRVYGTLENQSSITAAYISTIKTLYEQAAPSVYARGSKGRSTKGYPAQSDDQPH